MTKAKYTDEQRAEMARENGRRLAEWRRMNPETDEQRAERIRKSQDGQNRMSPEAKASRSGKLRASATMQMNAPGARQRAARYAAEGHAKRGYTKRFEMTDEIRAKIASAQIGKPKAWTRDRAKWGAACEKISDFHRTRMQTLGSSHELMQPEARSKAIERSREEMKTNPNRGPFVTNIHATDWHIRDPRGIPHHFRNLAHFIRNNRHLFTAEELFVPNDDAHPGRTRAYSGINSICPRIRRPACSWHGWTWIAARNEDQWLDPLDRAMNAEKKQQETPCQT